MWVTKTSESVWKQSNRYRHFLCIGRVSIVRMPYVGRAKCKPEVKQSFFGSFDNDRIYIKYNYTTTRRWSNIFFLRHIDVRVTQPQVSDHILYNVFMLFEYLNWLLTYIGWITIHVPFLYQISKCTIVLLWWVVKFNKHVFGRVLVWLWFAHVLINSFIHAWWNCGPALF